MIAIQQSERNGKVVAATLVAPEDEIMLITDKGVLVRTRVAEIREMGRATQGVTLISLDEGAKLRACNALPKTMRMAMRATVMVRRPTAAQHQTPLPSKKRTTPHSASRGVFFHLRSIFLIAAGAHPCCASRDLTVRTMSRPFNFSAGPAAIPEEVLQQAANEMLNGAIPAWA